MIIMKNEIEKPEKILHAGRNAKLGIEFARPKGRYVDSTGLHLRIFIMKLCTFGQVVAWKVRCTTPSCVCACVCVCWHVDGVSAFQYYVALSASTW